LIVLFCDTAAQFAAVLQFSDSARQQRSCTSAHSPTLLHMYGRSIGHLRRPSHVLQQLSPPPTAGESVVLQRLSSPHISWPLTVDHPRILSTHGQVLFEKATAYDGLQVCMDQGLFSESWLSQPYVSCSSCRVSGSGGGLPRS
jgi:hypothetical protein